MIALLLTKGQSLWMLISNKETTSTSSQTKESGNAMTTKYGMKMDLKIYITKTNVVMQNGETYQILRRKELYCFR